MKGSLLAVSAVVVAACQARVPPTPGPTASQRPLALVGATLIDGTGAMPIEGAVLVIEGGRIACAASGSVCTLPAGAETIEVAGRWITPGLVDAHVHFSQTGWVDGRPDSIDVRDRYPYNEVQADLRFGVERFLRAYLCSGVTAVFDVGGYPWTWDLRRRTGPGLPHVAASGPLVTHADVPLVGMHPPAEQQFVTLSDAGAARAAVRYLEANRADAVKLWFLAPTSDQRDEIDARVAAVGEEARAAGLPLIVHATSLREAKVALRAGAKLLVHGVDDQAVDDEFIALAKAAGVLYMPTLTVMGGYERLFTSAVEGVAPTVIDPYGCVDAQTLARAASTSTLGGRLDPERFSREAWATRRARFAELYALERENLRRVRAAGITIAMGTDAGNPLTLHGPAVYPEMEAMQAAGMAPHEVLVASTLNGARAMGLADEIGTLEAGKIADFLVLTRDPTVDIANMRSIEQVWRGGDRVVMRSAE